MVAKAAPGPINIERREGTFYYHFMGLTLCHFTDGLINILCGVHGRVINWLDIC